MTEHELMNEIQVAVSAAGHKIFRVNVGEGWLYRQRPSAGTVEFENARARWFKTGVPAGYSDLSGCTNTGKAVFIEVKTATGKPTEQQCCFLLAMLAAGANAGIAHSTAEALAICDMTDGHRVEMGNYIHEQLERIRRSSK